MCKQYTKRQASDTEHRIAIGSHEQQGGCHNRGCCNETALLTTLEAETEAVLRAVVAHRAVKGQLAS